MMRASSADLRVPLSLGQINKTKYFWLMMSHNDITANERGVNSTK